VTRAVTSNSTTAAAGRPPRTVSKRFFTWRRTFLLVVVMAGAVIAALATIQTTRWVNSTGYIITDQEVEIRPSVEGPIADVLIRSGDHVDKGDLLVQLTDTVQRAAYEQAQSELNERKAQLKQLVSRQKLDLARRKEQTFQAEQELKLAKERLTRIDDGVKRGGGFSRAELDDARLNVNLAQSRVTELQLPVEEVWKDQISVMKQNIQSSTKSVALHQAELAVRQIRAPMSGTVFFNRFEPGEIVKSDHVLGQVFGAGPWVAKLKVDERYIGLVQQGQVVRIETSAYPAYRFEYLEAKVSSILPVVTPRATGDGIFYVEATIEPGTPYELKPGMTATAQIDTGQASWLYRILGW